MRKQCVPGLSSGGRGAWDEASDWYNHFSIRAIYNHWTGLVDWAGGLTLKIIFILYNETQSPVVLYGNPAALFLAVSIHGPKANNPLGL